MRALCLTACLLLTACVGDPDATPPERVLLTHRPDAECLVAADERVRDAEMQGISEEDQQRMRAQIYVDCVKWERASVDRVR